MSAPLVVNTRDGACWTRRAVTEGGVALYALADVCSCPDFVMATLAELAERGIVGLADVLPVPVGPRMPEFPPPPETELDRLHAERARLQGLLAEAVADARRARRERDDMRERVSEPYGCTHCGITKRGHGRRWTTGVGYHVWERPSDEQVRARMLTRRAARMPLGDVPERDVEDELTGARLSLWEEEQTTARLRLAWRSARRRARAYGEGILRHVADRDYWKDQCRQAQARVAELEAERHTTNEALDDAVQALRQREKHDTAIAKFVAERAEYITAIRNCHPDNGHDYDRWQGHAAARRQLAERLGLPVAWPKDDGPAVQKAAAKLQRMLAPSEGEHYAAVHHAHRTGRDLPETGGV